MYLIRRVWNVKPREARQAASVAAEIGKVYQDADQRDSVQVYFNGGTLPGEKDRVYMQWTTEVIDSPYRGENVFPDRTGELGAKMRSLTTESWIEFYELLTEDKALELD